MRLTLPAALICTLLVALSAMPASAEPDFASVGRLSYGFRPQSGANICTATLVAPDLILTAAHCVADNSTGKAHDPQTIRFDAGWRKPRSLATRYGIEIILAQTEPLKPADLANDIALVRLSRPIPENVVTPMPLAAEVTAPLSLIAYSRAESEAPKGPTPCPLATTQPGLLILGCDVIVGNSGAPILGLSKGEWQLTAITIARGGPNVAYATLIPGAFRILISPVPTAP
jgi:hypothetical protein